MNLAPVYLRAAQSDRLRIAVDFISLLPIQEERRRELLDVLNERVKSGDRVILTTRSDDPVMNLMAARFLPHIIPDKETRARFARAPGTYLYRSGELTDTVDIYLSCAEHAEDIPCWTRLDTAAPDVCARLRRVLAVEDDAQAASASRSHPGLSSGPV